MFTSKENQEIIKLYNNRWELYIKNNIEFLVKLYTQKKVLEILKDGTEKYKLLKQNIDYTKEWLLEWKEPNIKKPTKQEMEYLKKELNIEPNYQIIEEYKIKISHLLNINFWETPEKKNNTTQEDEEEDNKTQVIKRSIFYEWFIYDIFIKMVNKLKELEELEEERKLKKQKEKELQKEAERIWREQQREQQEEERRERDKRIKEIRQEQLKRLDDFYKKEEERKKNIKKSRGRSR